MQGVVFNAHYLAYVDDVMCQWIESVLGPLADSGFDYMVVKATIEWSAPARYGDTLVLRPAVSRWGTSSFDATIHAAIGDRPVFVCTLACVSVTPGTHTPCPVPVRLRSSLDREMAAGVAAAGS